MIHVDRHRGTIRVYVVVCNCVPGRERATFAGTIFVIFVSAREGSRTEAEREAGRRRVGRRRVEGGG